MIVKIFLITEVLAGGGEKIIAARLTHEAARAIAKLGGNRKVTRLHATKDVQISALDPNSSMKQQENENDYSTEYSGD